MKNLILLILTIFGLSCSKENSIPEKQLPYLVFNSNDSDKLLQNYTIGKLLVFKNQNNEELLFEVIKNEKTKKLHSRGNWVYASYSEEYFYYDEQIIELKSTLNTSNLIIDINKWPTSFSDGTNGTNVFVSNTSKLVANIDISTFNSGTSKLYFEYSYPTQTLLINGTNLQSVVKFDIPTTTFFNPNWVLPKIKVFYYDHYKGIVGFDDFQNKEWRIQN